MMLKQDLLAKRDLAETRFLIQLKKFQIKGLPSEGFYSTLGTR